MSSQLNTPVMPELMEWEVRTIAIARALDDHADMHASGLIRGMAGSLCAHIRYTLDPALNRPSRLDDGMRRFNWEANYRRIERFCKDKPPTEWETGRLNLCYHGAGKQAILRKWIRKVWRDDAFIVSGQGARMVGASAVVVAADGAMPC